MTKIISAGDARNQFSEMMNLVDYGQTELVVTRFDRPAVVWVDYEKWQDVNKPKPALRGNGAQALLEFAKLGLKAPKGLNLSVNYKKYLFDE